MNEMEEILFQLDNIIQISQYSMQQFIEAVKMVSFGWKFWCFSCICSKHRLFPMRQFRLSEKMAWRHQTTSGAVSRVQINIHECIHDKQYM